MAAFDYPKNEGVAFVEQEELIAIRRQLHQIPEIGLEEKETQAFLLNEIDKMKQPYLQVRTWQTGILVFIEGKILRKPSAGVLILMVCLFKRKWFLLSIKTTRVYACLWTRFSHDNRFRGFERIKSTATRQ